jgi:hypothetical protein
MIKLQYDTESGLLVKKTNKGGGLVFNDVFESAYFIAHTHHYRPDKNGRTVDDIYPVDL